METNAPVTPEALATRIRMVMGAQKLSRKRLSELTGISRPSLANKLDGKVSFTYDELLAVIEALGVAWDELLAGPLMEPPPRLRDLSPRTDRRL
jgi:transcriptional regulator with XRE-family HTH domain